MKNNRKKINRGLIVMNKSERIAIITLLVIIAILLAFSVFRPALHFSNKDMVAFHNLDSLIALQEEAQKNQANALASHNGNSESSKDDKLYDFPKSSSNFASSNNTLKFTTKSESSKKNSMTPTPKKIPILELNATDSVALVALPQIGEVMASRIQRYRDRLGGYVCYEQLYEVKGMDSARFATVRPYLLLDDSNIRRLEVNRDEFKTLLRHPYLEYEHVKAIVNYRERKGLIRNWEQLKGIVGEVNPLLERYVSY